MRDFAENVCANFFLIKIVVCIEKYRYLYCIANRKTILIDVIQLSKKLFIDYFDKIHDIFSWHYYYY